jgi:hypothetical protein
MSNFNNTDLRKETNMSDNQMTAEQWRQAQINEADNRIKAGLQIDPKNCEVAILRGLLLDPYEVLSDLNLRAEMRGRRARQCQRPNRHQQVCSCSRQRHMGAVVASARGHAGRFGTKVAGDHRRSTTIGRTALRSPAAEGAGKMTACRVFGRFDAAFG